MTRALKAALAIAFFLGFGGFFVFLGFQSVELHLTRGPDGRVDATVTRHHFLGLYRVTARASGVKAATIETRRTSGSAARPGGLPRVTTSNVVLEAASGDLPLFTGYSNVDEAYRRTIARRLNVFLGRADAARLSEVFRVRNVFGWVGLPFLLVGLLGLLGWPLTLLRGRRGPPR